MEKILNNVESPFTDEFIKELFVKYLKSASLSELYANINNEKQHKKFFSTGLGDYYDLDDLDFRIYLNLRDDEGELFVKEFSRKGKENDVLARYKYTADYGDGVVETTSEGKKSFRYAFIGSDRKDNFVVYLNEDNLEKTMNILEELENTFNYDELPPLVGKYKNNIGITSESLNPGETSYTQERLGFLPKALLEVVNKNKNLQDKYIELSVKNAENVRDENVKYYEDILSKNGKFADEDQKEDYYYYKDYYIESIKEISMRDIEKANDSYKEYMKYSNKEEFFNSNKDDEEYQEQASENDIELEKYIEACRRNKQREQELLLFENIDEIRTVLKEEFLNNDELLKQVVEEYRNVMEREGISKDGVFTKDIEDKIRDCKNKEEMSI